MSSDPGKEIDQALAKINQDKSWIVANKAWLIPIATLIVGFIVAKLV